MAFALSRRLSRVLASRLARELGVATACHPEGFAVEKEDRNSNTHAKGKHHHQGSNRITKDERDKVLS